MFYVYYWTQKINEPKMGQIKVFSNQLIIVAIFSFIHLLNIKYPLNIHINTKNIKKKSQ